MPKKRNPKLGYDALVEEVVSPPKKETKPKKPKEKAKGKTGKPKTTRTTVTLTVEDMALLEELKTTERRRKGERVFYGDILGEALRLLARKKEIGEKP